MRISDWSSDVCSSDLDRRARRGRQRQRPHLGYRGRRHPTQCGDRRHGSAEPDGPLLIFRARGAGALASTGASAMIELTLDIFKNDAFSVTSLQRVVDKTPYTPHALGRMQIFAPKP